jgi:hypothetical protein
MFSSVPEILTYDGSATDIILNYVAFLANTIALAAVCIGSARSRCGENRSRKQPTIIVLSNHSTWLLITLFLVFFQIFLCSVIVRCVGISVVWSAQCSFSLLLFLFLQNPFSKKSLFASTLISTSLSLALWIYYLIVSDLITTIAHICSIVLGLALFILLRIMCRGGEPPSQGEENPLMC